MAGRPTDDELRKMLQSLPRPEPPSGFAARVMAKVRAEERRRRARPWLLAAAAVALVASGLAIQSLGGALFGGTDGTSDDRDRVVAGASALDGAAADPERDEFEAILAEYRSLANEIEAMRRLGGEPPYGPLIRVGGSEDLDLFLDAESYLNWPVGSGGGPRRVPVVLPASDRRPR